MDRPKWIQKDGYQEVVGRTCVISLEPRPKYCDRGNFIAHAYGTIEFMAKLDASGTLKRDLDDADLWPRYYFDEERAKLEIEAWLEKRNQMPFVKTDVIGATHVTCPDGTIEPIIEKIGISPEGRLRKPSEGGFSVKTESGRVVHMMEAGDYLR